MPPIRNKVDIQNRLKAGKSSDIFGNDELQKNTQKLKDGQKGKDEKILKRDITPMFDYYKAWDNFADVSKSIQNLISQAHSILLLSYRKPSRTLRREMMHPQISSQLKTLSRWTRKLHNHKLKC